MECPLRDPDGNARKLSDIEFGDIEQLASIDEGYAVEYKGVWDRAVKDKMPKVISSFANAAGGWILSVLMMM